MVAFLKTEGISSELSDMIMNSKVKLYLVSPYLQISDKIKTMLLQAEKRHPRLDIKVIYRPKEHRSDKDNELFDKEIDFLLNQLENTDAYSLDNLHAKCYLNENIAIITSLNLYQYSQANNWEMGIKIDKSIEPDIYEKISEHVSYLIDISTKCDKGLGNSNKVPAHTGYEEKKLNQTSNVVYTGYCIRCGQSIVFNPDKPLCSTCFKSWSRYMEGSYRENYCHACGIADEISVNKPLCINCYSQLNQ